MKNCQALTDEELSDTMRDRLRSLYASKCLNAASYRSALGADVDHEPPSWSSELERHESAGDCCKVIRPTLRV